jgi:hypothetical protein
MFPSKDCDLATERYLVQKAKDVFSQILACDRRKSTDKPNLLVMSSTVLISR